MPVKIDLKKCVRCGTCANHCPEDVIAMTKTKTPRVKYPDECWHCGACMIDCKARAIQIELPLFMRLVPEPYRGKLRDVVKKY